MGFDGVVKNINKYCYVNYDAFIKKYLFSLFLVDFSRFVVNHICANEIDKEEKDLLDCINQFMGTEDYEVYSDWFEIIEGELSRIYCNSCDIDTFFDNVPSFVINLVEVIVLVTVRDPDNLEVPLSPNLKRSVNSLGFGLVSSCLVCV